jgi:hypothetical protein
MMTNLPFVNCLLLLKENEDLGEKVAAKQIGALKVESSKRRRTRCLLDPSRSSELPSHLTENLYMTCTGTSHSQSASCAFILYQDLLLLSNNALVHAVWST